MTWISRKSSHVHNITIVAAKGGDFGDIPATITYERPRKSDGATADIKLEKATVLSTGRGLVRIMSNFEYNTSIKSHRKQWIALFFVSFLLIGFPYVRYVKLMESLNKK